MAEVGTFRREGDEAGPEGIVGRRVRKMEEGGGTGG